MKFALLGAAIALSAASFFPSAGHAATLKVVFEHTPSNDVTGPRGDLKTRLTLWFANDDTTGARNGFTGNELVARQWTDTDALGTEGVVKGRNGFAGTGLLDSTALDNSNMTFGAYRNFALNETIETFGYNGLIGSGGRFGFEESAQGASGKSILTGFVDSANRFSLSVDLNQDGTYDETALRLFNVLNLTEFSQTSTSFSPVGPMPSVPLPAGGLLLLTGVAGFAAFKRRKS